jgi:hypothetical protein
MPIPMPPPPPPYVAPDLRPIVARPGGTLTFVEDRATGRIVERYLDHGLWISAEGAPLELRFHKRADGSVWGEQATYADGDRQGGIARASAGAYTQVLSKRMVGGMGVASQLVRYELLDAGGSAVRTWSSPTCGATGAARLDRTDSPAEPTFPTGWWDCSVDVGGAYVLGRLIGLDRGWAMPAASSIDKLRRVAAGQYRLRMTIDPLEAIADADRTNNVATIPVTVRTRVTSAEDDELPPGMPPITSARAHDGHAAPEPEWYQTRLRVLEAAVEARRARREAGPAPRAGEPAPAPPTGVELPDLRSAPSYGISMQALPGGTGAKPRDLLRFGALTWNAGPGHLELESFRERGTMLTAYQVFTSDGERSTRQARGTMVWHAAPGHNHFHFSAFAGYTLTDLDGTLVRQGGKHSWCIVDTDQVDPTLPGVGATKRSYDSASDCGSMPGSLWARMSLSVGSGDFYSGGIAGQAFDVTSLPNGSYRIRVEANPTGVIAEADSSNNVSTRIVRLGGRPGNRTVTARPIPTVDESMFDSESCADC